jgi:hypothetical protein
MFHIYLGEMYRSISVGIPAMHLSIRTDTEVKLKILNYITLLRVIFIDVDTGGQVLLIVCKEN